MMALLWSLVYSRGIWSSEKLGHFPQWGSWDKLVLFFLHCADVFLTQVLCVLRGFGGDEVQEGRTKGIAGAREIRNAWKIPHLTREGVASEFSCVILSSPFLAKWYFSQPGSVFSSVSNIPSQAQMTFCVLIVTTMISHACCAPPSSDITSQLIFTPHPIPPDIRDLYNIVGT
jgi:hypothetical protein